MEFIDLKAQYEALKKPINEAVLNVMQSTAFIMGPEVELFEQELAERVQVKHCISCANGTDALVIALMAKDIGPGDAVFVPSFTFMSTAECASNVGATPIMCDVDLRTYNMDPASLEAAIERVKAEGKLRPAAVIPVDLFGQLPQTVFHLQIDHMHHMARPARPDLGIDLSYRFKMKQLQLGF